MDRVIAPRLVDYDRLVVRGMAVVVVSVGGLLIWSARVPLSSAAIASGVVAVESSNKVVQHLEGGLVRVLHVREGDHVERQAELAQLDIEKQVAALASLRPLLEISLAQRARLMAERQRATTIELPPEVAGSLTAAAAVADQQRVFLARRLALEDRRDSLRNEKLQAESRLRGVLQQLTFQDIRLELTRDELESTTQLAARGWTASRRVLELNRAIAELGKERASLDGTAAETREEIEHAQLESNRVESSFLESVEIEMQAVEKDRYELVQRVRTIQDQVERATIRAPVSGTVVNLTVHTEGGVLAPGAALLELVPDGDPLVIEARVKPTDIDQVKAGMPAEIHLLGPEYHALPRIAGRVLVVSADHILDAAQGRPYFATRVALESTSLERIRPAVLRPGMPVEVLLVRRQRTVLDYLLAPIKDVMRRAMRE